MEEELAAGTGDGVHWTWRLIAGRVSPEEHRYLLAASPSGVAGTGYLRVLCLLGFLVVATPVNTERLEFGYVAVASLLLVGSILVPAIAAVEVAAPIDHIRAGTLPGDPIRVARLAVRCGLRMVFVSFAFAVVLGSEIMRRLFIHEPPDLVWWLVPIAIATGLSVLAIPVGAAYRLIAYSGAINPFTRIGRRGLMIVGFPLLVALVILFVGQKDPDSPISFGVFLVASGIVVWIEYALGIRAFKRGRL